MPLEADLIVEDGSGLTDSNTYISLTDADTYHDLRSHSIWNEASESDKVSALVIATDYLDTRWQWRGSKKSADQALDWPRLNAIDSDGVLWTDETPPVVKDACAEYALRVLGDGTALIPLTPDPLTDETGKFVTLKREKLGPLEEETRYSENRGVATIKPYPAVDQALVSSGLVVSSGGRSIRA